MATENKILYQTLEDRDNPDEIENHGPYSCNKEPWFGEGYYFWDTFIQLAHWWGKIGYRSNYVIGRLFYPYNPENFFDITGANPGHLEDLQDCIKEYFGSLQAKYTISQVIELMKERTNLLEVYQGIRGRGIHITDIPENDIPLKTGNHYYRFELFPPIQICIFDKSSFQKYQFKIVWPKHYICDDAPDMSTMTI